MPTKRHIFTRSWSVTKHYIKTLDAQKSIAMHDTLPDFVDLSATLGSLRELQKVDEKMHIPWQ